MGLSETQQDFQEGTFPRISGENIRFATFESRLGSEFYPLHSMQIMEM